MALTYNLMGEAKSYSSNAGASPSNELAENSGRKRKEMNNDSAKEKGKRTADEEPTQKKQKPGPLHSAMSGNRINILDINESLADMRTPSPIHVQTEDDEPPSPTGTEIFESNNEMDIFDEGFQEGMISALKGVQDVPTKEANQEEDAIEQSTIPD